LAAVRERDDEAVRRAKDVHRGSVDLAGLSPNWVRIPKPGSQPANNPVIRFVNAMLIFASHRSRNRIIKTPEAAMAMIMMAKMAPALTSLFVLPCSV
jgi:hypothetical protein